MAVHSSTYYMWMHWVLAGGPPGCPFGESRGRSADAPTPATAIRGVPQPGPGSGDVGHANEVRDPLAKHRNPDDRRKEPA